MEPTSQSRSSLTRPARRLPHIRLQPVDGGAEVPIIWRRTAPILLFLHSGNCPICRDYAAAVAAESEISEWDGRPLVILAEGAGSSDESGGLSIPVLEDVGNRLTTALSVTAPAVAIADQWGEIYENHAAGEDHDFLTTEELAGWARTIATKCPECEGEAF